MKLDFVWLIIYEKNFVHPNRPLILSIPVLRNNKQ